MKNIYEHQRFFNFKGATALPLLLLVLFLALSSRMIGGTISGTFTTLPPCPQSLNAMCIDPSSGFMYALGNGSSSAYFRYNIALGTWTTLASASHETDNNAGATLVNGKIYIAYTQYADLEVYTIATNSWATITGPAGGVNTGNISNDGTNLYIACEGNPGKFWRYNIAAGTYSALAAAPAVEPWGGLAYRNGYFYCSEGNGNRGFSRYQVATDTWEVLADVPSEDGAVLGAAIYDAYYYCMGGYGGTNLYSYDLGAQEWNNTLTLPWSIDDASICVYNGSLYIFQGEAGIGFTKFTPNNPILTNMEPSILRYTLGAAATYITATITASQNLGTNFASATVSITNNFESGKDVLSFVNANGITGSWNSTTGVLTLSGTTTIANYQAALRTVKYRNVDLTSSGQRTVAFQVYDGVIYSNTATRNINWPGAASVMTSDVTAITATSATSGGVVSDDGGLTVTARGVCWNTTGSPVATGSHTTNYFGIGSFTSSITGLTNGTVYHVRAYATNSNSTAYGAEKTFIASDNPYTVYAGADGSTCGSSYAVSGSAYGLYPVNYTEWTSGGDGNFDNNSALATTYYPGANDLSTGFVTLTLFAEFTDPATTTLTDDMTLTISTSVGGDVNPASAGACSGTNSTLLTLENYTGTIQKWQYSANGTDWTDIAASTASTYTATNLTASRYYRAVVKNGTCSAANSDHTLITTENPPVTGDLAKTPDVATVFDGTNVSAVLTPGSGGNGIDALKYRTKTGTAWSDFSDYISGAAISTTGKTGAEVRTWRESPVCGDDFQVMVDWIVQLKPTPGTIAASQTICYNTTPAAFTSTAGTGIGTITYEWQTNASGSYVTISGATIETYQAPALTATTSYQRRTVAYTGGTYYYSDYTTPVTITVQSVPTAGAIAASQTICYNTAPALLTSTAGGGSGTISYEWQTNATGSYVTISGATTATYQPPALTATTSYQRRTVSTLSGNVCYSDYTTAVTVTVQTTPTAGSIGGLPLVLATGQTICNNTTPALITSTQAGSGSGTISYEWQTNATGSYVTIGGATDATYQPPALTATTSYQRRTVSTLSGNICYSVYTTPVMITVQSVIPAGAIGSAQTICYNATPAALHSLVASPVLPAISYEWQTNATGSYVTIGGATDETYQPPALPATTSYQRRTVSTLNGNVCYSGYTTPVTITVQSTPTAGAIASDQTICYNTAPALITSTTDGTGSGTITYKWQTDASGSYATIGGATAATYQPPALTATTSYQRRTISTLNGNTCITDYTTAVTVTVQTTPTAGAIAAAQTICSNTAPALLTSTTDGTGSGTITYEWQTNASGSYLNISGATDATYQPPTLSATTSYKRRTVSTLNGNACYSVYTTAVTITIDPVSVGGTVGTSTHVCTGTNTTVLTLTGKTGVVQKWQYSTNGGTDWSDIASATNTTYTATNLTVTTDYRAVVKSGTCPEAFSASATVTVDPTSNGGNISGGAIVCYGTNSTTLTLYGQTGTVVNWQYTSDGGYHWYDISGATNTTYTATNLTTTTSYRAVVQSGVCSATPGGYANVTVRPQFVAPVATGVQTICWNTAAAGLSATAASGGTGPYGYQWQNSPDEVSWANLDGETSLTLLPGDLYETTYYRILVTDRGTPSCATDLPGNTVKVTVRDPFTPSELSIAGNKTSACYNTAPGLITATPTTGGSGPPFNYQWQLKTTGGWSNTGTNSLTYQPGNLTLGTQFRLIASDAGTPGCGSVFSLNDLTITIDPLPIAAAGSDRAICLIESTQIGSTAVPGNTYSWSSVPAGFSSTEADPSVTPTVTTTYTLVETITATGCVKSNSVVVTVNPLPVAAAGADRAICLNGTTTLGIAALLGNTYSWTSVPAGFTSTLARPTVSPTVTTTYTLVETITATGCTGTHSVTVTVNPLPSAIAGADRAICLNASTTLGAMSKSTVTNTYVWSSVPAGFSSTLANPTVSPTVTTTYTVVETITATGCTNMNSVTVTVNPLPAATAGADRAICLNASTTLGAAAVTGNTYSWSSVPAGFTSTEANPAVSPAAATTYTLVETITATGCTNMHSVTVTVNPLPPAIAGTDRAICLGGNTTLGAPDTKYFVGSTYSWTSVPAGFTSTLARPTVSPTVTTTYTVVEIYLATGCTNTNSVTVTVNPLPAAFAGSDRAICLNGSTQLGSTAVTGNTYSWTSAPPGFTSTEADPTVSPAVTTTYTLTETITATGCIKSNSVVVTVNPLPAAIAGADRPVCLNGTTILGAAAVSGNTYSWTSLPAGFTSTEANPSVSPSINTTYTVEETVTATGCADTHSVTVTVNPLPAAIAGANRAICLGGSTVIGAPLTTPVTNTYAWSSVPVGFTSTLANPTVSPTVTTTYTVVETIPSTGCTNTNSVTVTVNPLPVAAAGSAAMICYGSGTPVGAAAVPGNSYSWTSVPSGYTSTEANPTVSPTVTTIYTVTETITATGCIKSNNVTISVRPEFIQASVPANQQVCYGTAPVALVATGASGGSGGYTYKWQSSIDGVTGWSNLPGATTLSYSPGSLISTTYYRILTTDIGTPSCGTDVASDNVKILVNDPLYPSVVTISPNVTAICLNATPGLLSATDATGGTGPFTYQWQHRLTSTSPWTNVGPNTQGNTTYQPGPVTVNTYYRVIAKDVGNPTCGSTFSNVVYITILPIPAAVAGADATICSGLSATIGGAPVSGSTFSWTSVPSGFTSTASNPTVSPTVTTTYSVVETITATGCTNTHSVTVTVNPLPAAAAGADRDICLNAGTTLGSAAVSGNTYAWSSVPSGFTSTLANPTVSPTVTTAYTLTEIITATGCTNTHSVTVTVNPLPSAIAGSDRAICLNESTTLGNVSKTISLNSYSWTSVPAGFTSTLANPTVSPTVTTTYTLTETITATGCTNTNSVIVTVNPLPLAIAGADRAICIGGNTTLGDVTKTPTLSTFSWTSVPSGFTSTLANPTVSPTVTTTYSLTETITATGCTNTHIVTVTVNPLPSAVAGADRSICLNASTTLGAAAVTGSTYSWTSVPAGFTSTEANPSVSPTVATIYTVAETITATGCTNNHSVTVTVNPLPAAVAGADRAICLNGSTTLGASATKEPVLNTYSWTSVPAGFTSTLARPTVSPTVTTTYTLVETITATGCTNSNSVTVTVNPLPGALAGDDRAICLNGSTTIGAASVTGSTYRWTSVPAGFNSTEANPSVSPLVTTTYTVEETITATGCTNMHSVTVTVNPLPEAVAGTNRAICLNGSTTLGAAAVTGSTYSWTSVPAGFTSTEANPSVSPTVTTTYAVVETITATGCTNTHSVTVTVNPLPEAVAGADRAICLNGSTTLGAPALKNGVLNSYSWTSVPAGFTSSLARPTVSPTVATTYTLVETITATGCTNSNSVTVTVNPLPAAVAGADRPICLNGSTTLGADAVTGSTYSWTSVPAGFTSTEANPSVSPTVTTTYTVAETITATGCTNMHCVTVTVNPLPAAVAGTDRAICLNAGTTLGAASVTGNTYSWTSVPAGFTSTAANPSVSPLVNTTYTVVETITATGCTNTHSVTVTVNPLPEAVAGSDRAICLNGSTTLGADAVTGSTYSWTSVPSGFTSTAANPSVSPLVTTTYTVVETITATGCTNTHGVVVTVNPLPSAVAGTNRAICLNGSTTLGATAVTGSTYSWTSVPAGFTSTEANPSVSPTVTTTYAVVETITATGCTNTHSVIVTVNPLPAAVAGTDRSICLNGSTTLGAASVTGSTYSWSSVPSGFTSTGANPSASPLVNTTYSVVETITATGCTNTHSVTVTVNPLPSAIAGADRAICLNASTTLGATGKSTIVNTYAWSSVPAGFSSTLANPTVSPTVTTTYTVVETIPVTGCTNTHSVVVTVNPLPAAVAGTDRAICLNASTTIGAASVTGNTYSWTSVPAGFTSTAANPSVSPLVNTTYTVVETVTATGCTNTHSVTVTVNPLPSAVAGADRAICLNGSTTIGAASVTGSTYSWTSVPAGFTSAAANPSVSPLVTTTYTVVETITATGCTNTHGVVVTVNPLPSAAAGTNRAICLNGSTTLGATAVTGSTYSWTSVPAGFTSTAANPSVSPLVTTTYTVVETTTATGCTNNHSVVVTVNPLPAAVAGADRAICLNASTTLGAASVTGSTYSWSSVPSGFTSTAANPSASPLVNTTYTVVETITVTGCTNTHSVTVTVNPLPAAAAGSARSICLNGSTTLGATAVTGSTYSWTSVPAGFTSTEANPSVSPTVSTTYTVVETITATGCTNNHSVVVTVNPLPAAVAGTDRAICLNASTTLGASSVTGSTYSWTSVPAGFTSTAANPSVSPLVTTTYTVVETVTATGCTNTHSVTVTVNPLPSATAGSARSICLNGSTTLGATAVTGSTYSWTSLPAGFTSTEANPSVSPLVTTTYTVVETITATGCTNNHSVVVTVNPLPAAAAGSDRAICLNAGTTLGAASVTGNTYSWTSVPAGFTSTAANPSASPLVTTTYTVVETITATGCTNTHSVTVTVNPLPPAIAGADRAICLGGNTTLGAALKNGAVNTFSWTSLPAGFTSTLANPVVSPTVTTTYTVVETITITGCTNTHSVTVTVNPLPSASAGADRAICFGSGTTLGAAAVTGSTYSWTSVPAGFTSTAANPYVSPAVTTTYAVAETITATGCTNTHSVVVTVNPIPVLSSTLLPVAICSGSTFSYTATSTTPGATFAWSRGTLAGITPAGTTGTGNVSEVLTNTTPSAVDVTYGYTTTASGCSSSVENVVVTVKPMPVLSSSLTPPSIGNGGTFAYTATSATAGTAFSWSRATVAGITQPGTTGTGDVSEVLSNPTTQPVNVTYVYTSSAGGCTNAGQNVVVTVNPTPELISTLTPPAVCSAATFTYIAASATPGATFAWSRATVAGIIPSGTTGTGNVSEVLINTTPAPIMVTYVYTTSVGGFSGTPQNVVVPINPTPMLSSTLSPPPVCTGSTFVYVATSATTGSTFGWSRITKPGIAQPGTSGTGNVSEVLTNTTALPVSVTYVYTTTANGCSNTAQNVVVSVRPLPAAVAGNARTICAGSATTLGATAVSGSSYSWTSVPVGFTSTEANPTVTPVVTTTYTVVESSAASGCSNSHSVVVTVNQALPVSVTIAADATEVCTGTLVTLTATPVNGGSGPGYQWKINGTDVSGATNSTYSFNLTATGTVVTCVLTSNATFCTAGSPAMSNVVTITVPDLCPTVTIIGTVATGETRCINATQTITIAGTGPFVVQDGGSVTMIAGQNIIYLPGTTVEPGGYMHGKIFDGTYCGLLTAPIATITSTEEEVPVIVTGNSFRLYPNPTTGKFTIEQTGGTLADVVRVEIYGMLGGKVMTGQLTGEKKHEFSIAEFSAGVYFVKVFAGKEAETIKLIKTN